MYKNLIRPILFLISPERVHDGIIGLLKVFSIIPFTKTLLRVFFMPKSKARRISLFGLEFDHPVGLAAGFDKNAEVYEMMGNMGFSFVEIGAVTPRGQKGNSKPRLFRLPQDKAIINRMGFNNKGLESAVNQLKNRKPGLIVGANIGKNSDTPNENANEDYYRCFHGLFPYVDYFTVNVSCPNITNLCELQDKDSLLELLDGIQKRNQEKEYPKPILLKISPDLNLDQINDTLNIIKQTKIDGIVAVNTTSTRRNLTYSEEKIKEIGNGGLSGQPLRDRATEIIRHIHKQTQGKLPIIAAGGIMTAKDAKEKLDAGASLVQIFTGFIYEGPALIKDIVKELNKG